MFSQSVPSHRAVHKEAQTLLRFLQLPAFPPIGRQSLLHPSLLSLRYLMDANLPGTGCSGAATSLLLTLLVLTPGLVSPDQLHPWLCRLTERAGMAEQALHTFDPDSHPFLPRFDLQSVALIVVTMKVLFGLDDHTEW